MRLTRDFLNRHEGLAEVGGEDGADVRLRAEQSLGVVALAGREAALGLLREEGREPSREDSHRLCQFSDLEGKGFQSGLGCGHSGRVFY